MLRIPFLLLAFFPALSYAGYCTDRNWDKATDYSSTSRERLSEDIDKFNKYVGIYNDFTFIYKIGSGSTIIDDRDFFDQLKDNAIKASNEADKLADLKSWMKRTKSKLKTSRDLWKKIAEYCYDEDSYADYKSGLKNSGYSSDRYAQASKLIKRIDELRESYLKEMKHIDRLTLSEEAKKLKGQALTCAEASRKTKQWRQRSDNVIASYENFYTSKHHSKHDHSLIVKETPTAYTRHYNASIGSPDNAKALMKEIRALKAFIDELQDAITSTSSWVEVPDRYTSALTKWSNTHQASLPTKLSEKDISNGIRMEPNQARYLQQYALTSRNISLEQIDQYGVEIDIDKQKRKSIVFFFSEKCHVNGGASNMTASVNGKSIDFELSCWNSGITEDSYQIASAKTKKEMNYLISEFKKKEKVTMSFNRGQKTHNVDVWANGFTLSWNTK